MMYFHWEEHRALAVRSVCLVAPLPAALHAGLWAPPHRPSAPLSPAAAWTAGPPCLPASTASRLGPRDYGTRWCFAEMFTTQNTLYTSHTRSYKPWKLETDGERQTLMVGGAIAKYLSPLWYVMDSCPMIIAPPNGSGTKRYEQTTLQQQI